MELLIVKFFNRHFGSLDPLANFICTYSFLAVFWLALATSAIFFDPLNGKKIFLGMAVGIGLHFAVEKGFVKTLLAKKIKRLRPYLAYPNEISHIGYCQIDSSFPSSHLSSNMAVFTVIFHYYPQYWPLMAAFILLLAFSRLHKGAHYLSDELAGIILGIIYGMAALNLVR